MLTYAANSKNFSLERYSNSDLHYLISGEIIDMIQNFLHVSTRRLANLVRITPFLICLATFMLSIGCSCEDPEVKFKNLMQSADKYFEEKKYDEARIQLQAASSIHPKDAEVYYKLAETLVRLGKLRRAIENYNSAINYNPRHKEALLHISSILLAGKQFEMAESHIQKLLEAYPEDNDALVLKANIEGMGPRKDYDAARIILNKVIKKDPKSVLAYASLGNVELSAERFGEAETYMVKALELEPNNPPLQMSLADLMSRQGRLDDAQKILEELLDKNPEHSGLNYILAEFLLRRGFGDKAQTQYIETIKKEPAKHDARDRLYDIYISTKRMDEAKALTADLKKLLPNDPGVRYFTGRDLELEGSGREAMSEFLESIKLLNNFAPGFRRAGLLELRFGKRREGLEHLNQAVAIDPNDVGARLALARSFFTERDFTQASEHLQQILSRYPRQLGANVLAADIALIEGDTDQARKVYDFLVKAFPKSPVGFFKLGLLEEKEKNHDKAIEWYKKTLEFDAGVLNPGRRYVKLLSASGMSIPDIIDNVKALRANSKKQKAEYDMLIGSLVLANSEDPNRFKTARSLFLGTIESNPNLIGAYFALGAIDAVSGDLDSAAKNYEKLLEKKPNHIPTMMLLALTREQQKKFDAAIAAYRKALKVAPRFGPAANNLAWLLAEEVEGGDLDEALSLAEIAKEELPKEPSVSDTLGWIHYRRKSPRVALPLLQEAVDLHRDAQPNAKPNAEILYHLASVQAEVGKKEDAKATIATAITAAGPKHAKLENMKKLQDSL